MSPTHSSARTPSRSPYLIDVRDVMHRPGELRERHLDLVAPERLGEGVASVPEGAHVHVDLRLEGLHEGILVSAAVDATAVGECVRCLDEVTLPVQVDIQELFAYSVDEAFDYSVRDDHVDLEPVVRDAVVLSLPFQPVCRPDCPGLDPETGQKLADDPDHQSRAASDPRWAVLEGLLTTEDSDASGAPRAE